MKWRLGHGKLPCLGTAVILLGFAGVGGKAAYAMNQLPLVQGRPPLVEPVMEPGRLVNGDFERPKDEWGGIKGWRLALGQPIGPGGGSISYGLSKEADNTSDTTQKLSLSNEAKKAVTFSLKQNILRYPKGTYTVSLIFEGDSQDGNSNTSLIANGKETAFGEFSGWKGWRQVTVSQVPVTEGGTLEIQVRGSMEPKQWMDIDDVQVVPSGQFKARVFESQKPPRQTPLAVHTNLQNGEFEEPETHGEIPGWNLEFGSWGIGTKRAVYKLTSEKDNKNTSQKLSIANSTRQKNPFSIRQLVTAPASGSYVAVCQIEAGNQGAGSKISLKANGAVADFGMELGWNHWKEVATKPFYAPAGQTIDLGVTGILAPDGWFDLDHVKIVPAAQYAPASNAVHIVDKVAAPKPGNAIVNGTFHQLLTWDVLDHPYGYLPGWTLPKTDFSTWKPLTYDNVFEANNIGKGNGPSDYTISQQVWLKPGEYTLDAYTGWKWDAANPDGICMRVAQTDGTLVAERYWNPGWGQIATDSFRVDQRQEMTVSFTFHLMPGKTAAIGNVELRSYPDQIQWISAAQLGGTSKKEDTTAIQLKFSKPIFDLDPEDFSVDGAKIDRMENHQGGNYVLYLDGIEANNKEKINITVKNPEGTKISPRKQSVLVYRDYDRVEDQMANTDFSSDVDWNMADYPDGYLEGWQLPKIDWNVWRYNVTGKEFSLNNISADPQQKTFAIKQLVKLQPGTYLLEAYSGWKYDAKNTRGIRLAVRDNRKVLASGAGNPGIGNLYTTPFTVDKETTVYGEADFSLAGGQGLGLSYLRIVPVNPVHWTEATQEGGQPNMADTKSILLGFDKEVPGLTLDGIAVQGAKASSLAAAGAKQYRLGLSEISARNGEMVTITLKNLPGIQIRPSEKQVVVYRDTYVKPDVNIPDHVVNGSFETGVDWTRPEYPDGYVEGWTLPVIDWRTWRYSTPAGSGFEVDNTSAESTPSTFTISQKVRLAPGTYELHGSSGYTWDKDNPAGVSLWVENQGQKLAQLTRNPGYGDLGAAEFKVDREIAAELNVRFTLPGGKTASISHIAITKKDSQGNGLPKLSHVPVATPSNAIPMASPSDAAPLVKALPKASPSDAQLRKGETK